MALRRPLGRTGLSVAPVGMGTMQLGWTVSDVAGMRLLDQYVDAGGNLVDTANMYGGDQSLESFAENRAHVGVSEDVIGRWQASRGCRDRIVLTTKVRARMWDGPDGEGLTRAHIVRAVEDSLRRLRTDHVDVLYAHWPDPDADPTEWLATFQELIDAGKVRHAGSSNFCDFAGGGDLLTPLLELADGDPRLARIACEQPRYNLVNRAEYEDTLQGIAVREGLGIVTYSSLASGFLAGDDAGQDGPCGGRSRQLAKYDTPDGRALRQALVAIADDRDVPVCAVSLAWALAQPGITAVLVGAETPGQLADAMAAGSLELDAVELAALSELSLAESTPEFVQW
jgi:aryl-alcohol dehydrogenase-like predicted oxidoreductase